MGVSEEDLRERAIEVKKKKTKSCATKSIRSFSWGYYGQNKNKDKNECDELLFVHTR